MISEKTLVARQVECMKLLQTVLLVEKGWTFHVDYTNSKSRLGRCSAGRR